MRFSIITITYNSDAYLSQTLSSVASQDFADYEHIIWDGGSTDKTLSIISSYPHIKLYQGKDFGISDAMNKGASFASGDFLLHLHSDDLLAHPKVLSYVDTALKTHPHIQWLYGQCTTIDSHGNQKKTFPFMPYDYKRLKKYNCISHPSTFISRGLFQKTGGFNPSLRYCMDYDLWLRLGQITPALSLPLVFSLFREHDHSLSTNQPLNVAKEAYLVRNRYCNFLERGRSKKIYKRRIKSLLET